MEKLNKKRTPKKERFKRMSITTVTYMEYPRLYVLIRNDLDPRYAAVQAGHAVAEWCLWRDGWENKTLIYLGVPDAESLLRWEKKLELRDIDYKIFCEPDIGNQPTALATCIWNKNDSKIFQKLELK
jgi:hypothetical protein